jgi:hypothetical protein
MATDDLGRHLASTVLAGDSGRDSYGVVRILSSSAGTPGQEREYEVGDEALVEGGLAEWVVAPVHYPSAGRRFDTNAEREPTPLDGVEAYPPAEPTTAARRAKARDTGSVAAHVADGLDAKLASRRVEVARGLGDSGGDAKQQAGLGSLGARSGPAAARSDLAADKQLAAAATGEGVNPDGPDDAAKARARTPQGLADRK